MRSHPTYLIALTLLLTGTHLTAQNCPYDLDGSGHVGDDDILVVLGDLGLPATSTDDGTDFNGNGTVDIRDVSELLRHQGTSCPPGDDPFPTMPEATGIFQGLHLVEHFVHTVELADDFDTIPAGWVTYRLYAEVANAEDEVHAVFGNAEHPMDITTDASFHINDVSPSSLAPEFNPIFFEVFPSMVYASWMSSGYSPEELYLSNGPFITGFDAEDPPWRESFEAGNSFQMNSETGSGILSISLSWSTAEPELPNLRVLGQFTLPQEASLSGEINLEVWDGSEENLSFNAYEVVTGLTFDNGNLGIMGCTDVEALNYNPEATVPDGSCEYFGDVDGDGIIGVDDILDIISDFGCTTCDDADLDGDGVVGIGDILIILGLI